jgi:hypothetical protein
MSSAHAVPAPVHHTDPHGRSTNIAFPIPAAIVSAIEGQPRPQPPMRHPDPSIIDAVVLEGLARAQSLTQAYNRPAFSGQEVIALKHFLNLQRDTLHQKESLAPNKARRRYVPPGGPNPGDELQQQFKKAHAAMLKGKPSRALDALMKPSSKPPLSPADITKIHLLHPHPSVLTLPASLIPTARELSLVPTITRKSALYVLNSINRDSAPGKSGFTHEFVRAIFVKHPEPFVALANAILHSSTPPDPTFAAGVLALQPKYDSKGAPNGVRPTVTKEPLQTWIARAALLEVRAAMKASIKPGQYCMTSDGTLLAALDLMCKLGTDPETIATMLDKTNAFNAHSRLQMLLAVREIFPSLYAVFYRWYATPTPIFFSGVQVCYASNGTNQGCLLAMFGYTLFDQVVKRNFLLQRLPSWPGMVAFADDLTMVHRLNRADINVGNMETQLEKSDASLNASKTATFNPTHVNDVTSSTKLYGTCLGNSLGVRELVTKFLTDWFVQVRIVRTFASVHPVDAWYLFATSLYAAIKSFARSNHLSSHELDMVNETLLTEVRFYLDAPDLLWNKIMAPLVNGGIGLMPIRNTAHAVRLKLLDNLPSPPPGQPTLPQRLLRAYQRCDPNVIVLPVDEVSPNEPQGDPVELDDWRKPVPRPRCFFGDFSSFLTTNVTLLPHPVFLAAAKIHLGITPLPVLEGPHTANARDIVSAFYASFNIRNTLVPLDFHPKSFTPIAKNLAPFLARALAPVVAHCVGIIALGARLDPAFVPPPPAVPPPLGPIAPQRPLPTAPDANPYNPKRLVVAEEQQPEAPAAPAVVDPPVVPVDAEPAVAPIVPAAAEPVADPIDVAPVAPVVPDPVVAQPPAAAVVADAAAPLPPERPPERPGRRPASAWFSDVADVAGLSLEPSAKKSRAAAEQPAELIAAAAAVPIAAPITDDAASAEEEQQTNQPPSSPSAVQPADHSATAAKRPHVGPDHNADDDPVADAAVEHQRKAPRGLDPTDYEGAAAAFDADLDPLAVLSPV